MSLPVLFSTSDDADELARVPGISAVPHDDNLRYFDVLIDGPGQSPYEGSCGFDRYCRGIFSPETSRW